MFCGASPEAAFYGDFYVKFLEGFLWRGVPFGALRKWRKWLKGAISPCAVFLFAERWGCKFDTAEEKRIIAFFLYYSRINRDFAQEKEDLLMLNNAQIELLQALSAMHTDEDLLSLKRALSSFFANRAEAQMDELWESGAWNEQTLSDLRTAHYRTPYGR